MALLQPGSVLLSSASLTLKAVQTPEIKDHVGVSGPYFRWAVSGDIQTQPLLRTVSESMVLPWLGSMLKSGSCIATKGYIEAHG